MVWNSDGPVKNGLFLNNESIRAVGPFTDLGDVQQTTSSVHLNGSRPIEDIHILVAL